MKIQRRVQQMQFGETMDTQTLATITLTDEEIEQAYRERRKYYNRCDLIHKLKGFADDDDGWDERLGWDDDDEIEIGNVVITGKQLKDKINDEKWMDGLIESFESALSNNDSYWESFWLTAEYVIEDELEEE